MWHEKIKPWRKGSFSCTIALYYNQSFVKMDQSYPDLAQIQTERLHIRVGRNYVKENKNQCAIPMKRCESEWLKIR